MPVYGTSSEQESRLQRQPAMPALPRKVDDLVEWAASLDRAIVGMYGVLADRAQHYLVTVGTAAFGAADTTKAITFNSPMDDTAYRVGLTALWNTKLWPSSIATTGFTINVSDAPGGGGSSVHWIVVR